MSMNQEARWQVNSVQRNFCRHFFIFWVSWATVNTPIPQSAPLPCPGTQGISFLSMFITRITLVYRQWKHRPWSSANCTTSYSVFGTHLFATVNFLIGLYIAIGTTMIDGKHPQRFALHCGFPAFLVDMCNFWFYNVQTNLASAAVSAVTVCRLKLK